MPNNPKILVVDDEQLYRHLVKVNLESEGYEVLTAANGEECLEMVSNKHPDLVILDINMPKLDGFSTLDRIRQFSEVPVIMLTGRNDEQDRVRGLNAGADDYVAKPFSATELIARVRAVMRRSIFNDQTISTRYFTHGDLKIDLARAEIWRDDTPIFLSATEYKLLIQFAHNVGKVMPSEELLSAIWGPQYRDDKEILWVSIARLRQKLEKDPHTPCHIVTRSGLGYLMPPVDSK
ncbi:MAG: DNA-binding response regulator [Chloroflexi bacterium 44-23]|nr:MAG: DNA-binding response regulator [Chloroflexi bacterium 44-23]